MPTAKQVSLLQQENLSIISTDHFEVIDTF